MIHPYAVAPQVHIHILLLKIKYVIKYKVCFPLFANAMATRALFSDRYTPLGGGEAARQPASLPGLLGFLSKLTKLTY